MTTSPQIEARERNWLIFQVKGMIGNVGQLASKLRQEPRIKGESIREYEAAVEALNLATGKILKDLKNGSK